MKLEEIKEISSYESSDDRYKELLKFEENEFREIRIRENSKFGQLKTWRLLKVIIKSGDDLRSEQFAM